MAQMASDKWLTKDEAAQELRIKPRAFQKHRHDLIRLGVRELRRGGRPLYSKSSLDAVLAKAARTGKPLW